jgi:hypothetical protein
MRAGLGVHRAELRERLNGVDAELRRERNIEALKLADARARARTHDTRRGDVAGVQAAVTASEERLALLDRRIVETIALAGPIAPAVSPPRPRVQQVADSEVAAAKASVRARLLVAGSLLDGLLPARATRRVRSAIAARLKRLE